MNFIPQTFTFWGRVLLGICFIALSLATLSPEISRAETAPEAKEETKVTKSEASQLIAILEDKKRRQEIIKLLELMVVLQNDKKEETPAVDSTKDKIQTELVGWLTKSMQGIFQDMIMSRDDLKLAWEDMKEIGTALGQPPALEMWHNYLIHVCLWGLICLLGTLLTRKKMGPVPALREDWTLLARIRIITKYYLLLITPSLVLIVTFWFIPVPSNLAVGVTADMATGFTLIFDITSFIFVNLSILYICLKGAGILFTVSPNGNSILNIHPVLARHFFRNFRFIAVYITLYIFLRDTFLDFFTTDPLYSISLALLILPIPIYITKRLVRLRHLMHQIKEAEITAGDLDTPTNLDADGSLISRLDYQADIFLKKHWLLVTIICIWTLGLISIFNPANMADRFVGHIALSLGNVVLAWLIIKGERKLALRRFSQETEQGRKILLNIDNIISIFIWVGLFFSILAIWGLPLRRILYDALVLNLLGRVVAIAATVISLVIFLKFSNMATEWLLNAPQRSENRNWRTMTPLMLTAVRTLSIFVALVVVLERMGVNVGPILAGAGILGLGVGMGAQSLVKDVINGISILLADTLAVRDYVSIGGLSGTVESVGLRNIRLRDTSNNLIVVPNSSIDTIINMTRDSSQDLVEFTAPYDADPDKMMTLAREVSHELSTDPDWDSLLVQAISMVGVVSFDSNGTTIRLRVHSVPGQQWTVGRELRLRLKRRMLQDGLKSPWFGQNVFLFEGQKNYDAPQHPDLKKEKEDKVDDVDRL